MLLDLIKSGILFDEDGKFSQSMRKRCLDLLGFGLWDNSTDLHALHINRAQEENLKIITEDIEPLEIDEHKTHINEHTIYLLSAEVTKSKNYEIIKNKIINHINLHKKYLNNEKE